MTAIDDALTDALERLGALELGDAFEPRAAKAIVASGLHRLVVPVAAGGLGARMAESVAVLAALGALDGSTALGFAMHIHVVGALVDSSEIPEALRVAVLRSIVADGALLNNAGTEEGGGSPARGAIPGTTAVSEPDGSWLVDLALDGVERRPGFEALGMRGSASGRLALDGVRVPADSVLVRRRADGPEPRGPAPGAWFGVAVAATYLGVGEGARSGVARWALDRRPGDGKTPVADLPSVQLRLGRLDAELRAARIVVLDVARRWDEAMAGGDATALAAAAGDVPLAKLVATRAAVAATDEALRIAGGPGFLSGRLERAFRDTRAGLINPPLEDVALPGFARTVLDRQRAP